MNVAEVYDRFARHHGFRGRLVRERLPESVQHSFNGFAERAEALIASARAVVPTLPPIHFDYIWEGSVNASVFKHEGEYFIAVHTGTPVLLSMIFCRMLSHPEFLLHVGDPTGESLDVPLLQRLLPDAEKMYQAGDLLSGTPKTESRWRYACYALAEAMQFLISHEISHITLGHVDYLDSIDGAGVFSEVSLTDSSSMGHLERHAIETEADSRALMAVLSAVSQTLDERHDPLPWTGKPPTATGLVFDCAFAVNMLFRVFGDQRMTGVDMSALYPPVPLRRLMLMSIMLGYSNHTWPELYEEFVKPATKLAVSEVEVGYAAITGEELSEDVKTDIFGDRAAAKEHMNLIIECLDDGLRERLKPFAYETLEDDWSSPRSNQPRAS